MADKKSKITLATKFVNSQIRFKQYQETWKDTDEIIAALRLLRDNIEETITQIENCELANLDTDFVTGLLKLTD